jgi:hypothetical protein
MVFAVVSGVLVSRGRENGNAVGGPDRCRSGVLPRFWGTARKLRVQRRMSQRRRTDGTADVGLAGSGHPGAGKDLIAEAPGFRQESACLGAGS